MPPRKKAKASAASTPLRDTQPKTPQESSSNLPLSHDDVLNDPWGDEQETQLFKSMMKWKPTGGSTCSHATQCARVDSFQACTSTFA